MFVRIARQRRVPWTLLLRGSAFGPAILPDGHDVGELVVTEHVEARVRTGRTAARDARRRQRLAKPLAEGAAALRVQAHQREARQMRPEGRQLREDRVLVAALHLADRGLKTGAAEHCCHVGHAQVLGRHHEVAVEEDDERHPEGGRFRDPWVEGEAVDVL
jgi:hypothetical protein